MISVMVVLEATLGGTRRHVVDLLRGIDRREFELTFVYSSLRADAKFLRDLPVLAREGIQLYELPLKREVRPWNDVVTCLRLAGIIRRVNPDILHLHGAKAGALGRAAALLCRPRAVVYTPHGGSFHKFSGLAGRIYLAFERGLAAVTDNHFIGVSGDSYEQIRVRLNVPPDRLHLIYNGVAPLDAASFDRPGPRERFVALYPAVFLPAKGHIRFLDALGGSPTPLDSRIEIWLAGDGPLRDEIIGRIHRYRLGHQVRILGFVDGMAPLYRQSDLVLLPSTDEAFGYVALEAMQYGRPILASPVGGLRELIQHDVNGRFFETNDWSDLSKCLNMYAADAEMRRRLAEAGKQYVFERFSLSRMIELTAAVYRHALAARC